MEARDDKDELGLTAVTAVVPSSTVDDLPGHLQLYVIGSGTFTTHPLQDSGSVTLGPDERRRNTDALSQVRLRSPAMRTPTAAA